MSDHFIKEIEIKNFKCFNDFKAEGFGRVNLIGGKNNVGKTAFMEAIYVNVSSHNIEALYSSIFFNSFIRKRLEYISKAITMEDKKKFLEKINFYSSISNIRLCKFEVSNKDGEKSYNFLIDSDEKIVNINSFSYDLMLIKDIEFLYSQGVSNNKLKRFYEVVQIKDKEEVLFTYINEFDSNILNFKIIGGDKPQCKIEEGIYRDIDEFGDGLKHYISIICSLYACENGYLFIDEIDNGIHYTQLDKLWEIILTISKEQNVQVFATTHSKECIESYARMTKKLKDRNITYSIITKLRSGKLHHSLYDYELLENAIIKHENEVR